MANTEDRKTVEGAGFKVGPGSTARPLELAEIPVTFDRKTGKTMPLEVAEEVLCRIYEHELLRPELAVIFTDVWMGVPVRKPIQHRPVKP